MEYPAVETRDQQRSFNTNRDLAMNTQYAVRSGCDYSMAVCVLEGQR